MARRVEIGEAKTRLSALLAEVEAGEDFTICRGETSVARLTRPEDDRRHAELGATLRRERARQRAVATDELLAWRHEGHARRWPSSSTPRSPPRCYDKLPKTSFYCNNARPDVPM